MPTTATPLAGFPDAVSAGVRAGVDLTVYNGDMTVTTDGAVISGVEIHGTLRIEADNVTVVDCKIVNDSYNNIIIPDPYSATVEYCDIVGGVNGISGAGTFRGNDFSQNENGINIYGASTIEDNYIHDLGGGADAHFDGIENNGASNVTISHNTVINDSAQTSAIMIDNYFGGLSNVVVDNNYLAGGGYTIYSDARFTDEPISGVQITNNVLGEGYYGYYAFMENEPLTQGNTEVGQAWPTPVSGGAVAEPTPAPTPEPPPVVAAPADPAPEPTPVTDTPSTPETPPVVVAPEDPAPTPVTDTPTAPPVVDSPATPAPETPVVTAPEPDPVVTPPSNDGHGHNHGHAHGHGHGRDHGVSDRGNLGGHGHDGGSGRHGGGEWSVADDDHGSMFANAGHLADAAGSHFMTGDADAFVF